MTFFGQFLVALLPDEGTAQTLGTAFLVVTSLVGGLNVQPQSIPDYYVALYWLAPIHYVRLRRHRRHPVPPSATSTTSPGSRRSSSSSHPTTASSAATSPLATAINK
mmetsp:Transcript_18010/g.58238  ORF Transcript_18010/g.58238 Transcript_18010/m.58238 type:complete len:107 (-) Transcript_18010:2104-2424(-)